MIKPRTAPAGAAAVLSHGAPGNAEVAQVRERVADLLEVQDASVFRVRAYRRAADEIRSLGRPVAELLEKGARWSPSRRARCAASAWCAAARTSAGRTTGSRERPGE